MTLVKTICMKCLGTREIRAIIPTEREDADGAMIASAETIVQKCPTCKGAGYLMVEGETK